MLMSTIDRRVDADDPVDLAHRIGISKQLGVDPIPRAIARIAAVPLPQCLPRPERARHVPPRRPHPIPPDDALDHPAVITKRPSPTPRGRGQQRPNPIPLRIRQYRISSHSRIIPRTPARNWETRPRPDASAPRCGRRTRARDAVGRSAQRTVRDDIVIMLAQMPATMHNERPIDVTDVPFEEAGASRDG